MAKSKRKKKPFKEKPFKQKILFIIRSIFLLLFLCALMLGIIIGSKVYKIKSNALSLIEEKGSVAFSESLTTLVYDSEKNVVASLSNEKDSYYLTFEEIPYMVKQIFITTEDRDFYNHSGVDYKSVLRAVLALIENEGEITQGGSTITQQLARNVYLSHEVSINRKITEMFIAMELSDLYTKDEILEFYINDIYFANGLYGVQAAAKGYFSKSVEQLSLSELCFICSIPNNPEKYNPLENIENTISRRNRILKQLFEAGIIDGKLYEEAINESIELSTSQKVKNNYVETFVRYCATRELMQLKGFEFQYFFENNEEREIYLDSYNKLYGECNSDLFKGGYRIYTSINMNQQKQLQSILDNNLSLSDDKNEEGVYSLQGSATCIDNSTGFVVAIVGGREQESEGYTLNRAYQSFRQPGSSIKPILIYAPLFERGYTPDSIVVDEKIPGGPINSPNVYSGDITLRAALTYSKNTIAWKLFEMIGYKNCLSYLKNMNFSHIVQEDYVPAMSIGGMTYGVSTFEMASAFSTLANNGIYRKATCIVKITDTFGNVIVDNGNNEESGKYIYKKNATLMTTNILKDVLSIGTGKNYRINNAICAGKTGTTNDNKDTWFVGYSRYYTTAVWCGYDMPKSMETNVLKKAGYIWKDYMGLIHENFEELDFSEYQENIKDTQEVTTPGIEETTSIEEATNEEPYNDIYVPETSEGDGIYIDNNY